MCPLGRLDQSQISPTKGRFDPLQISSKVPLYIMMIGVDGRARTGIIAGTARSGPTIFHKSNIYIYGYSGLEKERCTQLHYCE